MIDLLPVAAHLVAPEHAASVVTPPYDALTVEERAGLARAHPDGFLACLPSGADGEDLTGLRHRLDRLVATGRFRPLERGLLVVLELTEAGRTVTGLLGDVPVDAYLDGRIRPHEHVRPDRVAELSRYLTEVRIASSPVCVLHAPDDRLDAALHAVRQGPPEIAATLPDGIRLRLWPVRDPTVQDTLRARVRHLATCTVADGHHRAAAVARQVGWHPNGDPRAEQPDGRVLTALLPADQLDVQAFHRRIEGLDGVTSTDLLAVLATQGLAAVPLEARAAPERPGAVHVTVEGRWWRVHLGARTGPGAAGHLDAAVASREVVEPLATLAPGPGPATIVPVAAPVGLAALERPNAIGIALAPMGMQDLLAVTGAGEVLPFKSTYLTPKLRSGMLVVPR